MSTHDPHKRAEIASRTPEFMAAQSTKPFGWETLHWVRWATITDVLHRLDVVRGAQVLDLGCGAGWTSLFLAESGYRVTAVDLVPANVELTAARARRWQVPLDARVADMEELELGEKFDFVLIHDALHHCAREDRVLARVIAHLKPGGWLLIGETTWLHRVSPRAHRDARQTGWRERGFTVRSLRRRLAEAGYGEVRRFFQGSDPYEARLRGLAWQLVRMVAANVSAAPQAAIWLAAQRPPG